MSNSPTQSESNDNRNWRFDIHSVAELEGLAASLGVQVNAVEDISILMQPVRAGGLTMPNALAIHPMEGCDGDALGRPGELTVRRYERFGAGGAGLIWFEAIAVVQEGRANPRQLWIHEGSLPALRELVQRTRQAAANRLGTQHRPILVAQLTHSGRYSRPVDKPQPIIPQHNPFLDARMKLAADWPVVTDDYLDSLPQAFAQAAKLALEAGFDAIDVKCCHGYLFAELMACYQRPGRYGGTFENRSRLLLDCIDCIRAQLGSDVPLASRLGVYDAVEYPYGWAASRNDYRVPDLAEPMLLLEQFEKRGLRLVNTTIANPYYNPHYGRPYNRAVIGGAPQPEHPLVGVARITGLTARLQQAFPNVAMVGTGYSWLQGLMPNVAAAAITNGNARLVGVGRMAIAYPDFALDLMNDGKLDPDKVCLACSACTQMMRDGTTSGCLLRDSVVYKPIYLAGREAAKSK